MTKVSSLDEITARVPGAGRVPGLSWMAALLLLAGLPAMAKVRSDWSAVQAVQPGRRTAVVLYDDEAPRGARKISGRFASATAENVTLLLLAGQARTLERRAVRKVLTHRPFKKRWPGWAALGISATALELFCVGVGDCNLGVLHRLKMHGLFTGLITGGFFGGSGNAGIYNIPPKHRIP